jgi:hypothetical protein
LQTVINQGTLADYKQFAAAVYGEKRFLLQELSFYKLAVAQPAGAGAFGLSAAYSGNADLNHSKVGLAYGRKLNEKIAVGVQFNYWNRQVRGYGHVAQVTIEGGLLAHFSETLHVGFQVSNPAGVVLGKWGENVLPVYTLGGTYQPSQQFSLTAEVIKIRQQPLAVQSSIAYHITPKLWTKAGITSGSAAFFIAAGFWLQDFGLEAVGSVHPQLGFSPGLLLIYNGMGK